MRVTRLPLIRFPDFPGGRRQAFVVYKGPSAFDGEPIVGIVSGAGGSSVNDKTGPMAQLWIMRSDIYPQTAQQTGADASVCGDCAMRPLVARGTQVPSCYVVTYQSACSTWKSRRNQPTNLEGCATFMRRVGASLRLGAYGDPAALPEHVVRTLGNASASITGYTHAWRNPKAAWLKDLTMASVESEADALEAQALGWRTFRVREEDGPVAAGEIICPAATESGAKRRDGSRVQCITCKLCDGRLYEGDHRKNIVIVAHGAVNKKSVSLRRTA